MFLLSLYSYSQMNKFDFDGATNFGDVYKFIVN